MKYDLYDRYMSHGSTGTFGPTSIYGEEKVKPELTFDEISEAALRILAERAAKVAADADARNLGHDGGAGVIMEKVQYFRCGKNNLVPPEWKKVFDQAKKALIAQKDPEFVEYLRLKEKFE